MSHRVGPEDKRDFRRAAASTGGGGGPVSAASVTAVPNVILSSTNVQGNLDLADLDLQALNAGVLANNTLITNLGSNDVDNDSGSTPGVTVTDAIDVTYGITQSNNLFISNIGTDVIPNQSTLAAGATCSNALDSAFGQANTAIGAAATNALAIANLTSDAIGDTSTAGGADVEESLDNLQTAITGLDSGDVSNASGVTGGTVTAALNNLNSGLGGLGTDDVTNDSAIVPGATATDAINNALDPQVLQWRQANWDPIANPVGTFHDGTNINQRELLLCSLQAADINSNFRPMELRSSALATQVGGASGATFVQRSAAGNLQFTEDGYYRIDGNFTGIFPNDRPSETFFPERYYIFGNFGATEFSNVPLPIAGTGTSVEYVIGVNGVPPQTNQEAAVGLNTVNYVTRSGADVFFAWFCYTCAGTAVARDVRFVGKILVTKLR